MKPNLLLVGFQKSGSSYLFDLLTQHVDIKGTAPKETFYLTDEMYENFKFSKNISNENCSWSIFLPKKIDHIKYLLEGSVCNFYQKNALKFAKQNSEVKVLFILRDPVDRFISNFKYYKGNIPKLGKNITIEQYYENVKNGLYNQDSLKYSIEHGHYEKYINKWKHELGGNRVLIVSFKKLITEPDVELERICNFLKIDYDFNLYQNQKEVNASRNIKFEWFHKKLQTLFVKNFPLKEKLKAIYYLVFTNKSKLVVSDSFKQKLVMEYENEFKIFKDFF